MVRVFSTMFVSLIVFAVFLAVAGVAGLRVMLQLPLSAVQRFSR